MSRKTVDKRRLEDMNRALRRDDATGHGTTPADVSHALEGLPFINVLRDGGRRVTITARGGGSVAFEGGTQFERFNVKQIADVLKTLATRTK